MKILYPLINKHSEKFKIVGIDDCLSDKSVLFCVRCLKCGNDISVKFNNDGYKKLVCTNCKNKEMLKLKDMRSNLYDLEFISMEDYSAYTKSQYEKYKI